MHPRVPTPLLTAAQERELARRIEAGVLAAHLLATGSRPLAATREELLAIVSSGAAAWQHFLLANVRLVWKLAGREARCSGLPTAELFQEGFLALAGALQRFDPDKGRFSTFATIRIRQHLAEAGASRFGEFALPPGRALSVRRIRGLESALRQERGGEPRVDDLAAALGRSTASTRELLAYRPPVPLEVVAEATVWAETSPVDPDAGVYAAQLRRLLHGLDPQQAQVLRLRYGFTTGAPLDTGTVAERLGLSLSSVRRLEKRALAALLPLARGLHPAADEPLAG